MEKPPADFIQPEVFLLLPFQGTDIPMLLIFRFGLFNCNFFAVLEDMQWGFVTPQAFPYVVHV